MDKGNIRIGTSGYQYKHWRDVFYPKDLPQKRWFEYYAERFDTVEINNTFYHLPAAETFDDWHRRAPSGFCYALKFSRYGTHLKHLKQPDSTIPLFLDRAERLNDRLGPILVQLPPAWKCDLPRLSAFLDAAPKQHRWAVEFRNPTWLNDGVYALLRRHNTALCIHDLIPNHPHVLTADWLYLRYHGASAEGGDYSHQALTAQADFIQRHVADKLDVYAYFNNDAYGFAVKNALDLKRYVGLASSAAVHHDAGESPQPTPCQRPNAGL